MQSMQCPTCKNTISETTTHCPYCGAFISLTPQSAIEEQEMNKDVFVMADKPDIATSPDHHKALL